MDRSPPSCPERTISVTVRSPLEELLVERALCMAQEVRRATFQAPHGRVLDACENTAFDEARKLIRDSIQAASQEFIADAEKKKLRCAPVPVDTLAKTKARTPKSP
jgi:DNA-binding GntR family transcriptional regulator